MAEYGKKTVAELTEILKSRGLPSSGKKAELIARLNEDDKQAASKPEEPATEPTQPAPVDQTTAEPEAATQPNDATTTAADDNPTATETNEAQEQTEPEQSATYTLNLKASDLDSEIAKRKARAERFGTGAGSTSNEETTETSNQESTDQQQQQQDDQAQKNLERAKRFGTESTAISKLDEALPSEHARSRARGNNKRKAEESALDDPGLKRGFGGNRGGGGGGRGGGRFRRGGGGGGGARENSRNATPGSRPQGINKQPAYTSDKDKLAAEARRKKFATA